MTREEYETKIDEKIASYYNHIVMKVSNMATESLKEMKAELMSEFKEEEPSIDGWKVGDKYYVRFDGREIHIETIGCDDKGKIYDFDIYNVTHGYAKRTAEEVQFQAERDAVLYALNKFAEPEDREWDKITKHFFITWDFWEDGISIKALFAYKHNDIYFATKEDAEKAIQAVGEERIKRFYLGVE